MKQPPESPGAQEHFPITLDQPPFWGWATSHTPLTFYSPMGWELLRPDYTEHVYHPSHQAPEATGPRVHRDSHAPESDTPQKHQQGHRAATLASSQVRPPRTRRGCPRGLLPTKPGPHPFSSPPLLSPSLGKF